MKFIILNGRYVSQSKTSRINSDAIFMTYLFCTHQSQQGRHIRVMYTPISTRPTHTCYVHTNLNKADTYVLCTHQSQQGRHVVSDGNTGVRVLQRQEQKLQNNRWFYIVLSPLLRPGQSEPLSS